MNSDPNNDSEQCTESNWVECTMHTPIAQATHALGAVSWCALAPYRGHDCPCCRPCRRPPDHETKFVSQQRPLPHALSRACRSASAPCRKALLRRIAALLPCIATPNGRPQPRYKFCITTHPWQAMHARATTIPCARPSRVMALLAVSWGRVTRPPGHIVAPL